MYIKKSNLSKNRVKGSYSCKLGQIAFNFHLLENIVDLNV